MDGFNATYRGIVTNNVDPEGFGRIKAVCPQVFGDGVQESGWAWPTSFPSLVVLYSNGNNGIPQTGARNLVVPQPGQGVWLSFEGGDTEYPIWSGMWS